MPLTNPVIIKLNEITTFVQDKSKLTEEEVQEIGIDWGSFTEGETSIVEHEDYPKCKVVFNGTEYGDDTQIEIQGDTAD